MKRTKFTLSIAAILLASGAYAAANVAYAEGRDHKGAKKAENREHEPARTGESLAQGIPHPVTLSNLASTPLKDIEIRFSGANRTEFLQTNNCGEAIKEKGSCIINVTFMPRSPGPKAATMEVHTSGGSQLVYLTGTGM